MKGMRTMRVTDERLKEAMLVSAGIEAKLEQYREDMWSDYMFSTGLSWRFIQYLRERVE